MTPVGAIEASALAVAMRQSLWLYPIVEIVHLSGIALLVGCLRGTLLVPGGVSWPPLAGWARVALLLGALAVSFVLLETVGFLIASTVFMAVMIFALGERSWTMLTVVPVASAAALYGVFAVWLKVPLPKGPFEALIGFQ